MPGNVGFSEILLLLAVLLIVFGPKRLPQIGRSLGQGPRDFKHALAERDQQQQAGEGEGAGVGKTVDGGDAVAEDRDAARPTGTPR